MLFTFFYVINFKICTDGGKWIIHEDDESIKLHQGAACSAHKKHRQKDYFDGLLIYRQLQLRFLCEVLTKRHIVVRDASVTYDNRPAYIFAGYPKEMDKFFQYQQRLAAADQRNVHILKLHDWGTVRPRRKALKKK